MSATMAWTKSHNLLDLSWVDVAEYLRTEDLVVVPVGSCEKHGAHIPLGTDAIITIGVVELAARKAGVLHAPLLPVGYSPHHMGDAGQGVGTLTFTAETLNRMLYEVGRCLVFHGFNRIVYATHHGSNTKVIDPFLRRLRYETGAFVAFYKTPTERECHVVADLIEGPPEETPGWHSGEIETAMLMAYDADLVDLSRAVRDRAHAPRWMGEAFTKRDGMGTVAFRGSENIFVPMEHHEYSDTATIGNPFRANPEKGKRLFERGSDHLAAFLEEVKRFPVTVTRRDYPERVWG